MISQNRSERYSFFAIGPISSTERCKLYQFTRLTKGPHGAILFCLVGQVSRPVSGKGNLTLSSRTQARLLCIQFSACEEVCCTELMAVLDLWTNPVKVIHLLDTWRTDCRHRLWVIQGSSLQTREDGLKTTTYLRTCDTLHNTSKKKVTLTIKLYTKCYLHIACALFRQYTI